MQSAKDAVQIKECHAMREGNCKVIAQRTFQSLIYFITEQ